MWLPPLASVLILDAVLIALVLVLGGVHRRVLAAMTGAELADGDPA